MVQYTKEMKQRRIAALLEERRQCETQGKTRRVQEINEELGEVAKDAELPSKRSEKRPATEAATTR